MPELTIGELARRSGLRTSAIRYYESQGILPSPRRINGRRRYDDDVLYFINAIQVAKLAGFSIAEMQQLFRGVQEQETPSTMWRRFAETKLLEVEALDQPCAGDEAAPARRFALWLPGLGGLCSCWTFTDRDSLVVRSGRRRRQDRLARIDQVSLIRARLGDPKPVRVAGRMPPMQWTSS